MADLDAPTLAKRAVDLGLVTPEQLSECREELAKLGDDPLPVCRWFERKGYLTPWQTSKLLRDDGEGYFLGGYRILYRIAAGSFGRVFRADDPRTGNVVAIKVLRRRHTEDPHQVDLFEREGKVGLTLRHPNLVTILAVSRDPASGQYYIVMEFVEGGNLRDFLSIRKKLEPAEALKLLEDAVSGLAHAYSRGVSHRDMKLTNILISSQGTAKLVDFGLAGLYSQEQPAVEGQVDRTVDYAGLEKATNVQPGDIRSDIYFLGCVFYEMLTGRFPLMKTRDKRARMLRNRFENSLPLHEDEVGGHRVIIRLTERMMALNPRSRYQTPSQLLLAIRDARREVEGKGSKDQIAGVSMASPERTVFVVEKSPRIQDALRGAFKQLGYRVFMSVDPDNALGRFRQQPFDALVVDAATTGDEAVVVFGRVLREAERQKRPCAAILILSKEQANQASQVPQNSHVAVLVRPVTLRALADKLRELAPPR